MTTPTTSAMGPPETAATKSPDSVTIQVLSDLHLEMSDRPFAQSSLSEWEYDVPVKADILALLGDIGLTLDDRLFAWLRLQLKRFKLVFFLSGNHEAYRSTLKESQSKLAKFAKECDKQAKKAARAGSNSEPFGRFVLLDRTRYDLSETVTVLGCTLWSRLDPENIDIVRFGLNDFRMIGGLTTDVYQALHARDVVWLGTTLADIARNEPWRRVVVMTHHAPTVAGTSDPKYEGGPTNSAFTTELTAEHWWDARVLKVWMFGHTHWPCDFERNGVRVLSNAKGYSRGGDPGYVPDFTVEV